MKFTVKDILEMEVILALGCTEPVAIALGAAAAATLLPEKEFDSVEIWIDPNIYKNGMAVTIPGTGGMQGLDTAAALGAYGGNPGRGLEVLECLDQTTLTKAQKLLDENKVIVNLRDEVGLYVRTKLISGSNTAESLIVDLHNNIVSLKKNGEEINDSPLLAASHHKGGKHTLAELETWLRELTLPEILELTADLDEDDLNFLEVGVNHNLALAEYGLKHGSGLGIGKAIDRLIKQKLDGEGYVQFGAQAHLSGCRCAHGRGQPAGHEFSRQRQSWPDRHFTDLGDQGFYRPRPGNLITGDRTEPYCHRLCQGPYRQALCRLRLFHRCRGRGDSRHHLSGRRRRAPYGRGN